MLNNFIPCSQFDMDMREKLINAICKEYSFVECNILGKSLCNRDIHCLKIGSSNNPVLFVSAFHGMEWLTSLLVLMFIGNMCDSIKHSRKFCEVDMQHFLNKHSLFVIPCINPDGVEISIHGSKKAGPYENLVNSIMNYGDTTSWQSNARGVDLNHNFNANWEELHQLEINNNIVGPGPTRYGGPHPESEPESKLLVDLCKSINFKHAIAFHSQGEEIYWNYGKNTPSISAYMGKVMAELSGYELSAPEGLAVGGGFKDWFINAFSKPAFTVEIGKGQNPLPIDDINDIYQKLESMLVYCIVI